MGMGVLFNLACVVACSCSAATLDPFRFEHDMEGWHISASSLSLSLTWRDSGVTWRSPLLEIASGTRTASANTGCWRHEIQSVKPGGTCNLTSGTRAGDTVILEGSAVMPTGQVNPWSIELSSTVVGAMSFKIQVATNVSAAGIEDQRHGGAGAYVFDSLEVALRWVLADGEHVFGAGEQYSTVDLVGRVFPLWSGEQGIGRGLRPITEAIDEFCPPCGGDWHTTYSFVPALLSSRGYGVVLENTQLITVDLRSTVAAMRVSFEVPHHGRPTSRDISGHILGGVGDVRSLLGPLTGITGVMSSPPDWMLDGLIVGAEGGHSLVSKYIDNLVVAGVPIVGVWIQDWAGKVTTPNGRFVWWNWKLDEHLYPRAWFRELASKGIRVLTYVNPFLVTSPGDGGKAPEMFLEAKRLGYLIEDVHGEPILEKVGFAGFTHGTVNLFKAEARQWWVNVLRCHVLQACDTGPPLVHAWMHDYGESFPLDGAVRLNGSAELLGSDIHNLFPSYSQDVARAAVAGLPNTTFFTRSGNLWSPGKTGLFWLGDQLTSWDACDGMRSALIGAMSGGLSGWTVNHMDLGGFTMVDRMRHLPMPGIHFRRDAAMLVRWMELGVFLGAVFRSHPGLIPSISSQPWDKAVVKTTRVLSMLFHDLKPYREFLLSEAKLEGLPLVRHGILVHPEDSTWFNATQHSRFDVLPSKCSAGKQIGLSQFFFGDEVLVAPVLTEAESRSGKVPVYLPSGDWTNFWSNATVRGPAYATGRAPLGRPLFFFRERGANSSAWRWTSFFRALSRNWRNRKPEEVLFV